jgi:hypothetical protein
LHLVKRYWEPPRGAGEALIDMGTVSKPIWPMYDDKARKSHQQHGKR